MGDEFKTISLSIIDHANTLDNSDSSANSADITETNYSLDSDSIETSVLDTSSNANYDFSLDSDNELDGLACKQDYFSDSEKITGILQDFKCENWEQLSLDDKKDSISRLADYNADALGIENKPRIEYYNKEEAGDYGGYSELDNVIYINEYNMNDSIETADTICHEYRHTFQHKRAMDPTSEQDNCFRENFENYIPASRDFQSYQEQPVEKDAREYAQAFKDYINR